jgi:hypothetical protein
LTIRQIKRRNPDSKQIKKMITFFLILAMSVFRADPVTSDIQVSVDGEGAHIENSVFTRLIEFSGSTPSSIAAVSVYDKATGIEWMAGSSSLWFDFTINGEEVTNLDTRWLFEDSEIRTLGNGGKEVSLHFLRTGGAADGLRLTHVAQYFPNATLFREQLKLGGGSDLALYHRDGAVHLVFPSYELQVTDFQNLGLEEINIASWNADLLPNSEYEVAFDERSLVEGWREGRDLSKNYMYHPQFHAYEEVGHSNQSFRGPILITLDNQLAAGWVTAYEHGSPDNDPEQEYLVLDAYAGNPGFGIQTRTQKGAFFHEENVSDNNPFESVWVMNGFFHGNTMDDGHALVWDYLYRWITEDMYSRAPLFYYNTWGWQRSAGSRGEDERAILTEERILEEIDYAAELGIDLFVLDDGWQNNFGDWLPDEDKLPNGLEPIRKKLEEKGIMFGIWLALFAHDSIAEVARENPEWIILDEDGNPEIGNWDRQVFNFVGPYMDYFIDVNKRLIDDGVRYFKWDGMDRHLSDSPHNFHGDESRPSAERRSRYGFELTRHITRAIAELKEYQEDVVIEVDITEPYRSVGLDILSEGRYFWMNNGSSWYDDLTFYRAKSSRFPLHLYGSFIPTVLMTVANYPHDLPTHRAQRYNVHSSIAGGRGFWGDLEAMSKEERQRVAHYIEPAQRVAETVAGIRPEIKGEVGASPEIYTSIDREKAEGQIIGFTGSVLEYNHRVSGITVENALGVVGHAYRLSGNNLDIDFRFPMGDSSRDAYLLSNGNSGVTVIASTSWLKNLEWNESKLIIINGAPGTHKIHWPVKLGKPEVEADKKADVELTELKDDKIYLIEVTTHDSETVVRAWNVP